MGQITLQSTHILTSLSSVRSFFQPYYHPKPKELVELENWNKEHPIIPDRIYQIPEHYVQPKIYIDSKGKGAKNFVRGDKPELKILEGNPKHDESVDLEKLFESGEYPRDYGTVWFNQISKRLEVLAYLEKGTSQHYQSRNQNNRRKLKSRIQPKVDPKEIPMDRTHLIPVGYHGSESDNRLMVLWDRKDNQVTFNNFEDGMKNTQSDIYWYTGITRKPYGLEWHYKVVDAESGEILGELFTEMGSRSNPIDTNWNYGDGVYIPMDYESETNSEDEENTNVEYQFDPELEKEYLLKTKAKANLEFVVGINKAGEPVKLDLSKCPHLLVAGGTGSGKSVGVNSWVQQMMAHNTPFNVQFLAIDPKFVEFSAYKDNPYFPIDPVTDMEDALALLAWVCEVMDKRYRMLETAGVKNIGSYNKKIAKNVEWARENGLFHLNDIVFIVDEFSDLRDVAGDKVDDYIKRIGQKARACGIHLILTTQRPSADVVSGVIKINIPARICFSVPTSGNSRIILNDREGGEKLLGRGDLLLLDTANKGPEPIRCQSLYFDDDELKSQLEWYKNHYPKVNKIPYKREMINWKLAEWGPDVNEDTPEEERHIVVKKRKAG